MPAAEPTLSPRARAAASARVGSWTLAVTAIVVASCAAAPPVQPSGTGDAANAGAKPVPFGSHAFAYPTSVMFPSAPRAERDRVVAAFYDRWKARYLTTGCGGIYVHTSGGTGADEALTVSEGHGYGMMVTALMAGHDPAARATFDEMVRLFLRYPGAINRDLMSWAIGPGCVPTQGVDSATDGDLDIAFAFLLANRQWGSAGAIDYLAAARKTIAAVAASDFNSETALPLLGDWATNATFKHATRPSDFMVDHVRAFAPINNRSLFTSSVDRMYEMIVRVQGSMGRTTGLLPDFLIDTNGDPRPAPPGFLERSTDGDYAYNACRVPLRLATDFVVSSDARARAALAPLNKFFREKSGGDPNRIVDGYRLDGTELRPRAAGDSDDASAAFVGPIAAAAIVEGTDQAWVDALWRWMATREPQSYYADSLRLLSMIVMSGNWWAP